MIDGYGREIDYLRISITDRCDLRCIYCMPECGVEMLKHSDILTYEQLIRLAGIFAKVGIKKIRITGGEPLVRNGVADLVRGLYGVPGIETVVLTTNGMLLSEQLPALAAAGISRINISLDAVDEDVFESITRRSGSGRVLKAIDDTLAMGIPVKLNCVPTSMNRTQIVPLVRFASERHIPIRFIELMPIGEGVKLQGLGEAQVMGLIGEAFGTLTPFDTGDPREKCRYYSLPSGDKVGFIGAVSHKFCSTCNRVRLTADGFLKTCLQYDTGVQLKPLLTESDEVIRAAIVGAIEGKPREHHFGTERESGDEKRKMSQIGG